MPETGPPSSRYYFQRIANWANLVGALHKIREAIELVLEEFEARAQAQKPDKLELVTVTLGCQSFLGVMFSRVFSIIGNSSLVSKVYLPRCVIVISDNVANPVGTGLEFSVLLPPLIFLRVDFSMFAFFLPIVLVLEFLLVFALSLSPFPSPIC